MCVFAKLIIHIGRQDKEAFNKIKLTEMIGKIWKYGLLKSVIRPNF